MSFPVYFELSWAILSTIGLVNVCLGIIVLGITGTSLIAVVPVVVSAAGAIANGLCYYAFYAEYPTTNTAVASVFADLGWLVQEAGLSFYSYVILTRVLRNRSRVIFISLFWSIITVTVLLRLIILISRVRYILGDSEDVSLQRLIDHLHVGYFASIAVVEIVSSVFLLRTFRSAKKFSTDAAQKGSLFTHLMRSTEIRLALLAVIGTMRAITYSFQETAQSATSVASQLDRFAYTMECMFPIVMFIDILASRLVFSANGSYGAHGTSSRSHGAQSANRGPRQYTQNFDGDFHMDSMPRNEWQVEAQRSRNDRTSSQEHIIEGRNSRMGSTLDSEDPTLEDTGKKGGISRTVEFTVVETRSDAA